MSVTIKVVKKVIEITAYPTGLQGLPGSVWRTGIGVPSNSLGVNTDFYLDVVTGNVYVKAAGAYTFATNIIGPTGLAGSVWRSGAGAPSNGLGVNTDFYLDTNNGNVYVKAANVYTLATNITGPQGTPGSVWRNGSGVPSNGLGVNGDYYINLVNGDMYVKASNTYTVFMNIVPEEVESAQMVYSLYLANR